MDQNDNSSKITNGIRLRTGKTGQAVPTTNTGLAANSGQANRSEENIFIEKPSIVNLQKPKIVQTAPAYCIYAVICFYAVLFYVQVYLDTYQFPKPLLLEDVMLHPNDFIAERAMNRLIQLTEIGPRVAGSYENEVLAVEVLKNDIEDIIKKTSHAHSIELDIQKYSGSFPLGFLDGLTNVYRNVQNVIVKLGPKHGSSHSLLINCHFDSVPDSPGGSDDGAGCAIMLEILDVLSKSENELKNNIIFLFNGAEENLMHASHGFITQHPWAKEVRAFINLEACGAGGREVLFQSGPNSPWIMKTYAKSVLYPFASSMAQEVFESGVIPGDTDFRVFRDFGNVSGLDFAWSTNGYVYHTKYDNSDQIPLGSLQRTGENILALAQGMANADELSEVEKHRAGNMIYFDVMGMFLIHWPEHVGTFMNVATIILSAYVLYSNFKDAEAVGINSTVYLKQYVKAFGIFYLCALSSALVVFCISGFVSLVGRSMSWYSRPLWLFFLYVIPCLTTAMTLKVYFLPKQLEVVDSRMLLFQMYYDVYQLFWTSILLITVAFKIRSGYLAWLWVIGPCLGSIAQRFISHPAKRKADWKWLSILLCSLLLPVIQFVSMQNGCFGLFIPIMGRSGASNNSEIIMALFTNATCALLFTYIGSLIILVENPKNVITSFSTVFLAALFLLLFTPLGFPYSGNTYAPKPQRFMIIHTERTFHNRHGVEVGSESGYWVVDHDINSPHTVKAFVPEMAYARLVGNDCEKHLYCGLPYLMPVLSFIWKTHWILSNPPKIEVPTKLQVLSRQNFSDTVYRVNLEIQGPDHLGLVISPKPHVKLLNWSLNEEGPVPGPKWNGQETYFIYYASSSDHAPWKFSVDYEMLTANETSMDVALISHFLHGPSKTGLVFKRMLAQFPPWTAVTAWTATYKSFVL